jgi:histidyl-tRNA synthetase
VSGLLAALATRSVADLAELLGPEGAEATDELRRLFELGEAYGLGEWLVFDASVVRGLAYYTGEPAPAPVCDP